MQQRLGMPHLPLPISLPLGPVNFAGSADSKSSDPHNYPQAIEQNPMLYD